MSGADKHAEACRAFVQAARSVSDAMLAVFRVRDDGTLCAAPVKDGATRPPCLERPDDRAYKTIGLAPCPDCGNSDCFLHYLRWESGRGISLNADMHHLVDGTGHDPGDEDRRDR